ncbi:MAG: cupredoxin domain-containing protein [Armatimonadota bacterium]|nr:cupredoxin domain-containing protein [Armatimonadota bacterium]MDR5702262.1 cupredoxin domain-containing protein [Armatimonadota bacterium]MDR7434550.1 cupredoxin domain-containing protein [Armatimonadota bacterium]
MAAFYSLMETWRDRRRSEAVAWILVLAVVVGLPALVVLARFLGWGEISPASGISLIAGDGKWRPEVIHAVVGQRVRLRLQAVEGTHGFTIPDYGITLIVPEGEERTTEFLATRAGRFPFYCPIPCDHDRSTPSARKMAGWLVVAPRGSVDRP